jgi:hypothetical protein
VSLTEKRLCFNDGFFEINILSCWWIWFHKLTQKLSCIDNW